MYCLAFLFALFKKKKKSKIDEKASGLTVSGMLLCAAQQKLDDVDQRA